MHNPTMSGRCPHCKRGPGIRETLDAIGAILQTLLLSQVLSGWRLLAVTAYVSGLILVDQRASILRICRYLPAASQDQVTRLLGQRDLPTLLMAALRLLAHALTQRLGAPIWIVDDVIIPKPTSLKLPWAKGLWCPSEQRYVRAIKVVVLLARWGRCVSRWVFDCGVRRNVPHRSSIGQNWIWQSN